MKNAESLWDFKPQYLVPSQLIYYVLIFLLLYCCHVVWGGHSQNMLHPLLITHTHTKRKKIIQIKLKLRRNDDTNYSSQNVIDTLDKYALQTHVRIQINQC